MEKPMEKPLKQKLLEILQDLSEEELKLFQWYLQNPELLDGFEAIKKCFLQRADRVDTVDLMVEMYTSYHVLEVTNFILKKIKITEEKILHVVSTKPSTSEDLSVNVSHREVQRNKTKQKRSNKDLILIGSAQFLRRMKQKGLADCLQSKTTASVCQHKLQSSLKKNVQCVFEGIAKAGNPTLLNQIYTELYITEGGSGEVNEEHEVRQIERQSGKPHRAEKTIQLQDIIKAPTGGDQPIRIVMTKGAAGIGKTVLTQKFMLDWAEKKANQDIQFIFPFTFRELNLLKEKKFSLVELVHHFFTETKEICSFEHFQVLFIFDGLDESRLPLDFQSTEILTDVTESNSVHVLLTNLIRGKLFPSAYLWITTRPAAACLIPPDCVDMVTEVRGFTDPQKENYFKKRFRDEMQATSINSHIKTSRSLHIMCHIPVFCWITAMVLEDVLESKKGGELPKSLTEMYIHFLVVQTKVKKVKYDGGSETDPPWSQDNKKMIESLGKLAFDQLQKGNLIFYESDLTDCGIDIRAASLYSGVFTQIFKEERGLYQNKVYCFVHLSVQEFLAALHVHLTFRKDGVNLLESCDKMGAKSELYTKKSKVFYQSAVDKTLQSKNGHLDLFLRFLLGLSLKANQILLGDFSKQMDIPLETSKETVLYIKEKLNEDLSVEKSINLFHCLNELNDHSLVEEIQQSLRSGSLSTDKLSPSQWSALVFILLSSEKDLDVFDLKRYSASEEALLRLLPVIKTSNKVLLGGCNLSKQSCEAFFSVLTSPSCQVKELDLSDNILQDSGVQLLSSWLASPYCRLEILRLSRCNLSGDNFKPLSSVLTSISSGLRELDLSNNNLQDSGVKLLVPSLESPHCKLENLRLRCCNLSEESCEVLASVLSSQISSLREMDLRNNEMQDLRGKLASAALESPDSTLEVFKVEPVGVRWLKPGLRNFSYQLTFDTNTVNSSLKLTDNKRKVIVAPQHMSYPDHPDRFYLPQLLCREGLTDRCFWEVEWTGCVHIAASYRGIKRTGDIGLCWFGWNDQSWSMKCSHEGYSVWDDFRETSISSPPVSNRLAVYVDCSAGTLSFYEVFSNILMHIHTINSSFNEPLYPGFMLSVSSASVSLI